MDATTGMVYPNIKIENEHKTPPFVGMDGMAGMGGLGGMGMGGLGGLLFGLLLGGNRNGLFGGGNQDPMAALALGQLSDIKAAIPLASSEVKTALMSTENAVTNQANQNLIAVLQAVNGVSSKVDAATITNLQTELAEARAGYHARGGDLNVTTSVNQAQAQAQMQNQLNGLHNALAGLIVQNNRTAQDVIAVGGGIATGTQTPTNIQR